MMPELFKRSKLMLASTFLSAGLVLAACGPADTPATTPDTTTPQTVPADPAPADPAVAPADPATEPVTPAPTTPGN
ncbi:MAG: hypothetical protein M3498_01650 [Deinococcota bacterium]|jgi:cell division protein FtsN|nr:hypothetical protein [Deinococcota bacterium]